MSHLGSISFIINFDITKIMELNCLLSKTLGNLGRRSTCTSIIQDMNYFLLTKNIYVNPKLFFAFQKKIIKKNHFFFLNGVVVVVNCNF